MINPVRQEVLRVLAELSEVCPEVRLGQLMANLSYLARGLSNEAIWDTEDEELLTARASIWSSGGSAEGRAPNRPAAGDRGRVT